MIRKKVDLPREIYDFPEGEVKHVNWREIEPDPPGWLPGTYGDVETELIVCRENNSSEQTVMGRSVYSPGAYHEPHYHFYAEEFIYCLICLSLIWIISIVVIWVEWSKSTVSL